MELCRCAITTARRALRNKRRAANGSQADVRRHSFAAPSHTLSKNAAQYKNAPKLTVVHKTVAEPL
jgi:hypothetical protein